MGDQSRTWKEAVMGSGRCNIPTTAGGFRQNDTNLTFKVQKYLQECQKQYRNIPGQLKRLFAYVTTGRDLTNITEEIHA